MSAPSPTAGCYTARQAKANKLVDDVVNTYDDAVAQMQKECDLEDAEVYEFCYQPDESLFSSLVTSAKKLAGAAGEKSDISALTKLNGKAGSYRATVLM